MTVDPLTAIPNFLPISDAIATAGQPTAEQFSSIKAAGYQVVVNLALPSSPNALAQEQAIVEAQGMDYAHIPVLWDAPQREDFERFCAVMEANADKAVFVHCAANMRVSAFMYLYRRLRQGVDAETTAQSLQQIWQPNAVWQAFIDRAIAGECDHA